MSGRNWLDDLLLKVQGAITALQSGTAKPVRAKWNFIGATIADNPSEERLDITIAGASPSSALPQNLGTAAAGSGTAYSRDDHVHAHGNQAGGALHPAATGSVAGFMSAADKTAFDAATDAATASTLVKRDANGAASFKKTLKVTDGTDVQVTIFDAAPTSVSSGVGLWNATNQLRAMSQAVEHEVTSSLDSQGYNDVFGSIRIPDRVGQILATDGVDTYEVVGIPTSQLPSGDWLARVWVDWIAKDITDGSTLAYGTVVANLKCVSGTVSVFPSRGGGQEIGTVSNGTTSLDTTTDKPGIAADLPGAGDVSFVITTLNSNQVRCTARMRDFLLFQTD